MKRKVWELTVLDNPNRAVGGESDIFYTTDTEAFLIFRLTDADFNPATATLTLINTSDKSVISETVPVIDKEIEWEMTEEAIAHSGNWQAQLVYTQEKDGKAERYTSQVVQFDVQSHLMTGRQPTLVAIEDWNTFMAAAEELLNQLEDEAGDIFIDIEELERQYRDSEQARVDAENVRETNETARQTEESQRASSEQQREANESLRESSETNRVSAEQNRVTAENERNDLYDLVQQKLENGEFVGEKGDTGDGLEYVWNGTQLGVRKEGETEYVYVDLKGDKGDTGEIENLDSSHIVGALGYVPISETDVPEPTWANLQNKPTEFNPISHAHSINDVTGLRAELDSVPELTKENVGLGNVDNVKQASKVEHDQLVTDFSEHQTEVTAQLAQKATVHDLSLKRDKSTPIGLNDAGADLLGAIDGGTGATVEVLSIPRDYSVTPKKTTFFTNGGKNLFNKDDVTLGKYVNYTNGKVGDLATYGVTDFIEVLPDAVYTKTVTQQFAFYDENFNYISGLDRIKTFTTPSNCKYIRMSFELKDLDKNIQLELGAGATTYEPYKPVLMDNKINDYDKLVKLKQGKNLFDKSKAQQHEYINWANGGIAEGTDFWATDYIELEEGKTYTKTNNQQFAFYDSNKQFVSGVKVGFKFTVPVDVKYGRFTVIDKYGFSVDTFQLEEGSVATEYEPYKLILDKELLPNLSSDMTKGIVTVGINKGDYNSIQEAYDQTVGDVVILVLQGTYYEHLDINATNRKVSIIGVDAENTIIRDDSGDYHKAPLNANVNIYVENITFLSTHDDGTPYNIRSYAVHLDRSGAGVATFRNCKMISHQNSGIGIGTHQDQTIILDNCEIIKLSDYDGGALYIHNAQSSDVTNQKVITKNCVIKTDFGYAIRVDDSNTSNGGTNSPMDITFQFNILNSDTRDKDQRVLYRDAPIGEGVSGQIKLTSDSFGNNDVSING